MQPSIVIPVYQRLESLKRLIASVNNAGIPDNTTLVISVDGDADESVINYSKQLNWDKGEKVLKIHTDHKGLEEHILLCCDLALEYGSIILLEDDSFVVPGFYQYTQKALNFYQNDEKIAGISLYSYRLNENCSMPFIPHKQNSDVYFLQKTSTRGQAFTANQWKNFKKWKHSVSINIENEITVPEKILNWNKNSWERWHNLYLIASGKYFVYPYFSYSTNFAESGVHVKENTNYNAFQSVLSMSYHPLNFIDLKKATAIYNTFHELSADIYTQKLAYLREYDFTADLYGSIPLQKVKTPYLLSSRKTKNPLLSFGLHLIPPEANVFFQNKGDDIFLAHTNSFSKNFFDTIIHQFKLIYYFYPVFSGRKFFLSKMKERLRM